VKLDKSIIALLFQLYLELIEGILVVEVGNHVSLEGNSEVFAHMDGLSNEDFFRKRTFKMEFQTSKRFLRLTRDSISLDRGNGIFGLLPESWEKSSITNCEEPPPLEMREMVAISAFIPDKPDGSDPCNDMVIHYVTSIT